MSFSIKCIPTLINISILIDAKNITVNLLIILYVYKLFTLYIKIIDSLKYNSLLYINKYTEGENSTKPKDTTMNGKNLRSQRDIFFCKICFQT